MTTPAFTSTPEQAISVARLIAAQRAPYFRAALCGLIPREAVDGAAGSQPIPTLATTEGCVLYWNRAYVAKTPPETLAAALVHELGHVLQDCWRRGRAAVGSDPAGQRAWNVACDAEINDDLKAGGWSVGADWVYPSTLKQPDHQLAESYLEAAREAGGAPALGRGACTCPGDDAGKPGRSEAEVDRLRRQAAAEIQDHAQRGRSSVPAGWIRWAEQVLKPPKVRWQDKLARLCRAAVDYRAGQVVHAYDRPSRRQHGVGSGPGSPILPRMREPIARVMIAVDTSGSMGARELSDCMSEAAGIMRTTGAEVTFAACDAEVHSLRAVRGWREILPLLKGGGGTDFRPIFDSAMRLRPRPEVLVVLTDGCGPAPADPPFGIHTIWCLVGGYAKSPAAWGDAVVIDDPGRGARDKE